MIESLKERVRNLNYYKYLVSVTLDPLRGFRETTVKFDFPVTALIGPNGGGKSTFLGASALAYGSIAPRRFFPKNNVFDTSMTGWLIKYLVIDRDIRKHETIQRTASFRRSRWNRKALSRDVNIFGIARTVPASEQKTFLWFARSSFDVGEATIEDMSADTLDRVNAILGLDSTYKALVHPKEGSLQFLGATKNDDSRYSEFHFGAGESSVLRMLYTLESIPDHSLILIEEVENGLHPRATLRFVEYLIDLAARKKAQVIFTTHSPEALKPLPGEAIWAVLGDTAIQGEIDIFTLRTIKGYVNESKLIIYVEDDFAAKVLEHLLRLLHFQLRFAVEIHTAGGFGNVCRFTTEHNADPASRQKAIGFVDGDVGEDTCANEMVYVLPGNGLSPEKHIFLRVKDRLEEIKGLLAVKLGFPFEKGDWVAEVIRSITELNTHKLYLRVGERLGFLERSVVESAFISTWIEKIDLDDARHILLSIEHHVTDTSGNLT
ncbi:ATP-dependent nuclease [Oceanithermus sp.]